MRYASSIERPVSYEIRDALLDARKRVGSDFAYWPSYKLIVLIYSLDDFRTLRSEKPEWVAGEFDGKIRVPFPEGQTDLRAMKIVLFHEYAHALVQDLAKGKCPTWFNEGLAEYEGRRNGVGILMSLAQAEATNTLIPWSRMNDQFSMGLSSDQVRLGYEQSYSIVRYLAERYGFWRIRRALKSIGDGVPLETALPQEFHIKVSRLEEAWRKWLPQMLSTAAADPTAIRE